MSAVASSPEPTPPAAPVAASWQWDCQSAEASVDADWCESLNIEICHGAGALEHWLRLIHPDDAESLRRALMDAQLGSQTRFDVEYRVLTRDHRWVWVMHRAQLVSRNERGEPRHYAGVCIEVDQRREREQRARLNEARLQTALWGARAAFWQWHLPTDMRSESALWFAMTGYTEEQWGMEEDPWRARVHPADWPAVEAALQRFYQGGVDSLSYEYRLRIADGGWKWMLDRARAVDWGLDGKPTSLMGVSLDIGSQKTVESALRESESRLQTALWGARMGIWELDLTRDSIIWFDDWCERHDIDPCAGDGHTGRWRMNLHPADAGEVPRSYAEHLAGRHELYETEYRVRTRAGAWRWIVVRGRVIERGAGGEPRRMVGICMDMGERMAEAHQGGRVAPWIEAALRSGHSALWQWDSRTTLASFTDSYYELLGFQTAEGRADPDFWEHNVHPDDHARVTAQCRSVADGRSTGYEAVYRMRHAQGYWVTVHEHAHPLLRGADGGAPVVVGTVRMLGEGEGTPAPGL